MVTFLVSMLIGLSLIFMVVMVGSLVSFRSKMDREKSSSFECGFDSKSSARISFSLRFFLLAVIFLVFDVEIIFFFPIPFMVLSQISNMMIFLGFLVFTILLLGLLHEWREGSLDWFK